MSALSNLSTIGGGLSIVGNYALEELHFYSLTHITGGLTIENNGILSDCCGIRSILSNGTITGRVKIESNAQGCNSKNAVLAANCQTVAQNTTPKSAPQPSSKPSPQPSSKPTPKPNPAPSAKPTPKPSPQTGVKPAAGAYEKKLQRTRWELAACDNNLSYKFASDGTVTKNGDQSGTYAVTGETLSINLAGAATKRYTIARMTNNVMTLKDASNKVIVYARKIHLTAQKLSGTKWTLGSGSAGDQQLNFIDGRQVEILTIGDKGSRRTGTYTVDNKTKKLTIQLEAKSRKKASQSVYHVQAFNSMMLKLRQEGKSVECFNKTK